MALNSAIGGRFWFFAAIGGRFWLRTIDIGGRFWLMKMIPARARIDAARRQRPGRLFRYIYLGGAYLGGGFAPGYDPDMKMPRKARDALGRAENG